MSAAIDLNPQRAARDLFKRELANGWQPAGLWPYENADGHTLFYKVRLDPPAGSDERKLIRPMHLSGERWTLGLPAAPAAGWPLYRLPELLASDGIVYICEGEKAADALRRLEVIATTSGGASSASGADWTTLKGRSVRLWPDNDEAGAKYVVDVAECLHALGCTVEVLDVAALGLPDKGDAADWVTDTTTADDLDTLPWKTSTPVPTGASKSAPEPLRRPVPPPEPYPMAELGPILHPACESLRRVIQAPDAICGASLLSVASLAVQALANVEIDDRKCPLSLWFLTVAESGERKSAVDGEAMRSVREFEHELATQYDADMRVHEADLEEWTLRRDCAKKEPRKNKGEGLADALRSIGAPPLAPMKPYLVAADFTAEGLAKLLQLGRPSLGAFTDEAALVFGGHGMTKETTARTAATLCKLWDAGTLDRIRSGDGAIKLWGRRLSVHLMAQPVIAERALSDDVLAGQGFLARCLLAWPEGTAGFRPYRAESLREDPALMNYCDTISEALRLPLPIDDVERNELKPTALMLTPEAVEFWRTVHNTVEAQMAPGARYATCKPWASKTPEQCLRIAGVLTLIEGRQAIDKDTIERAAELALWHLNEAARLAGTAELSQEVRNAEALLHWCHATGRTLLHSGDALRLGPSRIRERETFTQAMAELVRAAWAAPVEGGAELGGRHRRNVWRILPELDGC